MDRILLALENKENSRILKEFLSLSGEVIEFQLSDPLPEDFDLCILDNANLEKLHTEIHKRKLDVAPVFLPFLLINSRRNNQEVIEVMLETVDDSISVPVQKAALFARVESLLRTRRLSLQLDEKNEQLEAVNEQLQFLNKEKNEFIGMMAHDFRNPLAAIKEFSKFLLDDARDGVTTLDSEQIEFITRIKSSSEFMLRLMNDLLDLSKIEAGTVSLQPQKVNFKELVEEVVAINSVLAESKKIKIQLQASDDLPQEILIDPNKIEQVLNNLLTNAVKFSHPETTVRLYLRPDNPGVQFTVEDEGQGIPASELDK
ncbi:MAG TPA: histidine kinase dimerization/phospho-acceptor domain-containing protein, partial [Patescibacteria group bacterium]|nr:histidine kinase dimerization/phospho-acceptor domain-containing protein [Patescibacteria group bacterium]